MGSERALFASACRRLPRSEPSSNH